MNKEEEEVPVGNIQEQCQISSSQESYQQNSPSVLDSDQVLFPEEEVEEEDDSDNTQLESIITISPSPPESPPSEGSIVDSSQEKEPAEEGGDGYDYEYVDSDKLGFSSVSQKVNVKGGQEKDTPAKQDEKLKALLNVLQMDDGKNDGPSEEVDLFETAKKLGMTFPRPRWWPPEGEEGF